ncbi:MAG: hypothetical protein IKK18_00060 [Clostridia bacterium]|nr:hypothetical protein [Clostridia bacterium]
MFKKNLKISSIMLILSLLLSACTSPISSGDDDLIVQAQSDNILNLGMDSVDTLNPILTKSTSVQECMQLIFEPLFTFDDAFNPICALAESCVSSPDGYSYTLKIKKGILWHDNSELTASDVLHTFNLIRYNDSYYTSMLAPVSGVSYIDKYTLKLTVSRPVPNFTALLSFPIVQADATTDVIDYIPIGTGPYKYDEKISSDKIQLIPNENWRETLATIDKVHINIVKDEQALINAYNASSVDILSSNVMDLLKNTPRGENNINDYISNNMVFLGINNEKSEFSSSNTRQALSYLIKRDEIVTTEIFSRAIPTKIPINPSAWYYPKSSDSETDPEYIKELLALDGWTTNENGNFTREKELTTENEVSVVNQTLKADILVNSDNDERLRVAEKIANTFSSFGILTTVTKASFEEYKSIISNDNHTMFIGEIKIPYNMDLHSLLVSDNNYFGYSSSDMKTIINKIGTAQSSEEIKTAYSNFSVKFLTDVPFVPLFFRKESIISEKSISGITMPTMFTSFRSPENWYIVRTKSTKNESDD